MYGLRPHLSTQDILIQIKEDILDRLPKGHKRCILALDIKGAFDNIGHHAILQGLSFIGCGQIVYNYVAAFLTKRTAIIGIGKLWSASSKMVARGTPQGSVSPLLFNLAKEDLPPLLQDIPSMCAKAHRTCNQPPTPPYSKDSTFQLYLVHRARAARGSRTSDSLHRAGASTAAPVVKICFIHSFASAERDLKKNTAEA